MTSSARSVSALFLVVALHAGAIAAAMWIPAPKTQELVLPTVQGILLPAPPAETVQAPAARETPPEPVPPPPKPEKPKPKPKPKEPPKPKPPLEPPPSERAIEQPEEVVETPPPPSQAAVAAEDENEALGAPVTPPQKDANPLNNPAPAYPNLSRRLGEQGTVLLEILILADGTVGEIRIKESSGHKRLDETAVKAVKRWRYTPAKRAGIAIDYWYLQPVDFSLN